MNMKVYNTLRTFYLLLFGMFVSQALAGEVAPFIRGQVLDSESGQPLQYATVSVLNAADSSLVTGNITDGEGEFKLAVEDGNYIIKIQFVTFQTKYLNVAGNKGNRQLDLGVIKVSPSETELDEVVVQGERTQMQLNLDKKVYNVGKDLSNMGGSASDMLDNLPSVTVDVDGNVALRGSSNVKVLIDGKPSGLVGMSSTDALKQLQSNLIESVEIITNPSARYDAEGQAGIINIVLKKEKQKGLNGTFQANTGAPHNHGVGINMNFRRKWVNFFVNYGLNYNRAPGTSFTNQQFFSADSSFYSDQLYERSRGGFSNNARVGADFNVGEKSVLTASFLYRYSNDLNINDLTIQDFDENRNLGVYTLRQDTETEVDRNQEYAINYIRDFKRKDQKFTATVQYQDNYENEVSDINQQSGPNETEVDSLLYQKVDNVQGEQRLMLQADYTHPFGDNSRFEIGYRSTLRNVYNDYKVDESANDRVYVPLDTFTFDFLYQEYVHAFYGIVSDEMDRFSWQAGMRVEISDIETEISGVTENKTYNYTNFFPSAFLTYKTVGASQLQLSYSRRINRPRYRDLSPLSSFSNNRSFRVGNPELQPEFTDSYELGYLQNFEDASIYYGVYYRSTNDPIQRVNRPASNDNITVSSEENLGLQKAIGFEINANKDFSKWYRLSGNFNFYRQEIFGNAYGEDLGAETVTFSTRLSNNINFHDFLTAQVNINYRAPEQQSQGRREAILVTDLGFSKDLWQKKGSVSLSVRDLFNSRKYRFSTETSNYIADAEWQWRRGPQFVLTLNYRLNQQKPNERPTNGDYGDGGDF